MHRIRCKFNVESITRPISGDTRTVRLRAVHDASIPEDEQFVKYTPSGTIEISVSNSAALEVLERGGYFYVDLTPIPPPDEVPAS